MYSYYKETKYTMPSNTMKCCKTNGKPIIINKENVIYIDSCDTDDNICYIKLATPNGCDIIPLAHSVDLMWTNCFGGKKDE